MAGLEYFITLFYWNSCPIVFDVDSPLIVTTDTDGHVGPTVFNSIDRKSVV